MNEEFKDASDINIILDEEANEIYLKVNSQI
jgi:hypothetical protein